MAAGGEPPSGYLYNEDLYVSTPPKDFSCPVCLCPVQRKPHLTDCCGKHFCHGCIDKVQRNGKACPMCNVTGTFNIFPNKERQREINQLKVRCPSMKASGNSQKDGSFGGCKWVGDLGEVEKHLLEKHGGFNVEEMPASVGAKKQKEAEELNNDACCSTSKSDLGFQQSVSCERMFNQQPDRNLFTEATPPVNSTSTYSHHAGDNVYSNHGKHNHSNHPYDNHGEHNQLYSNYGEHNHSNQLHSNTANPHVERDYNNRLIDNHDEENQGQYSGNVQQLGQQLSLLAVSNSAPASVPSNEVKVVYVYAHPPPPPPPWGPPPHHYPHHPPPPPHYPPPHFPPPPPHHPPPHHPPHHPPPHHPPPHWHHRPHHHPPHCRPHHPRFHH